MKKNLLICSTLTTLMLVLPATQANAGLFDRIKERINDRLHPVVEEPATQEINLDSYSDQAAILTSSLMKVAPLMKGKAQTGQLSEALNLDPSSLGLDMGENGIKVKDGLEVGLGGVSVEPIGVTLTVYMDNYRVLQETEYTEAVYADGTMNMTIGFDMASQQIVINMDSADYGPIVYSGGRLEGTTIEFDNVEIAISIEEMQFDIKGGTIYVNDMAISIEEMTELLGTLMEG